MKPAMELPAPVLGSPPTLTRRERQVLELVAAGLSTREVAQALFVSLQCVTYHVGNLLAKFQSTNRAGLVARAFVFGYLGSDSWPPRVLQPHSHPSVGADAEPRDLGRGRGQGLSLVVGTKPRSR
jgi:DNA-binding CsgD family transcriptional regulator